MSATTITYVKRKKRYLVDGIYSGVEKEIDDTITLNRAIKKKKEQSKLSKKSSSKLTPSKEKFRSYPIMQWADSSLMCNRLKEVEAYAKKKELIDFISNCSFSSLKDVEIICKWARFYQEKDTPYVVVLRRGAELVIFKEKREDKLIWIL